MKKFASSRVLALFENLPLQVKAFAASAVLLICLISLGAIAYVALDRSQEGLRTLSTIILPKEQAFAAVKDEIVAVQMETFRYVSWASNSVDAKLLKGLSDQIDQDLSTINWDLGTLSQRTDLSAAQKLDFKDLISKWKEYESAARDNIDVGSTDAAMGTMMLGQTDDKFTAVASDFQRMSDTVVIGTNAISNALYNDAAQKKIILAVGAAIGLLLSIIVSFVVSRSIVLPIKAVTNAMRHLSSGDTEVEVGYGNRRDEIGQMVEAIDVFRKTTIEKRALEVESLESEAKSLREIGEARRRLTDAIETISEGFSLYDAEDKLVVCNDRYKNLFASHAYVMEPGASFEKILRTAVERGLIADAEADPEAWIAQRIARHRAASEMHIQRRSDGRWIQVSERKTVNGGVVAIYADITELKQHEAELATARDAAETANRTKSQFLANMSHELRTPLNAIIGYSEILQEDVGELGQANLVPDLEKIENSGRHLLGLINDILDLSKVEAGKMDVFIEDVDIVPLLEEVRAIIVPMAEKNGDNIEFRLAENLGTMRTDRTKLKQSLLNVFSNASKFTQNGKLTLVADRFEAGAPMVRFAISDTGIGMSEEQLARLFQAFSQAETATAKKYGGTGLGLAITRNFCQMLGGDVTVVSRAGEGSTFTIAVPDRPAPTVVKHADVSHISSAPSDAPTVLVVDDDPAARDLLTANLKGAGYRLVHAASGEEALDLARKIRPDAITLDIMMPKPDGWEVLSALKADADLRNIPVVIVTMLSDRGIGLSLGAVDVLTKPVDRARLATLIHGLVRRDGPVLVVEDDSSARDMIRLSIGKQGLQVAEAPNGRQALDWLEVHPEPAVILLDLMMPEMDGFELLDELAANPKWREIPVIVLTAKQLTADERERLSGHAQKVMAKGSASRLDIAAAIGAAMRRRPARAAERI